MAWRIAMVLFISTATAFCSPQAIAQPAPVRPKPPAIKDRDWIQIPLDAFVLHQLEAAGLKPAPEATREELLRRLTLALAGRSATAAEIDAFVASKTKRAYEKEVDRLLESQGFNDRFGDAIRLLNKNDPRTARAVANRCWQTFFGRRLDNAEALEWLACELLDPTLVNCCDVDRPIPEAWSVKHLARAIVVSAIYRQSARVDNNMLRYDPENRLLGRGPQ